MAKARFEELKTLAEFDFRASPKTSAALIRDLATLHFLQRQESVLICGPVGMGKSNMAQALGFLACQQGYRVHYVKTPRLIADPAGGRADGTYDARLRSDRGPNSGRCPAEASCFTGSDRSQALQPGLHRTANDSRRTIPLRWRISVPWHAVVGGASFDRRTTQGTTPRISTIFFR